MIRLLRPPSRPEEEPDPFMLRGMPPSSPPDEPFDSFALPPSSPPDEPF